MIPNRFALILLLAAFLGLAAGPHPALAGDYAHYARSLLQGLPENSGARPDLEAYLDKLAAHQEQLRELARHAGWSFSTHQTDAPGAPALLALYQWLAADKRFRQ